MLRALAVSPLAVFIGLSLGVLGSGGTILAVPLLVHAAGESPQQATATSLFVVTVASLVGLPAHWRAGRVRIATAVAIGAAGIGGSIAGSRINRAIDPDLLLLAFAGLILIAAWRMLTACPSCTRTGEAAALAEQRAAASASPVDARRILLVVAGGTGIGFLTGLFGVGGGFVVVPLLTLLLEFTMPQAIGTSLLVVAMNSATALLARIATVDIDWGVAIAFSVATVAGVLAGGRIADRIDAEKTLRVFAAALVVLALFTGGSALVDFSRRS